MASASELVKEQAKLLARIEEINAELTLMGTKQCSKCKEVKSLDEFYRQGVSKDGLHPWCKQCVKEYSHKRHADNPEYSRQYYMNLSKEKKEYYAQRAAQRRANRTEEEKEHDAQRQADNSDYCHQYRIDNADKYRIYEANRRASSVTAEGAFTDEQFAALCEQYDNRCLCCGEIKKLTVDHIVPLSKGGSNDIDNIQPLCQSCNSKKHTETIDYRDTK